MSNKAPDEKELQEILENAREAENAAREMCKVITNHTAKYRAWSEEHKTKENLEKEKKYLTFSSDNLLKKES